MFIFRSMFSSKVLLVGLIKPGIWNKNLISKIICWLSPTHFFTSSSFFRKTYLKSKVRFINIACSQSLCREDERRNLCAHQCPTCAIGKQWCQYNVVPCATWRLKIPDKYKITNSVNAHITSLLPFVMSHEQSCQAFVDEYRMHEKSFSSFKAGGIGHWLLSTRRNISRRALHQ